MLKIVVNMFTTSSIVLYMLPTRPAGACRCLRRPHGPPQVAWKPHGFAGAALSRLPPSSKPRLLGLASLGSQPVIGAIAECWATASAKSSSSSRCLNRPKVYGGVTTLDLARTLASRTPRDDDPKE